MHELGFISCTNTYEFIRHIKFESRRYGITLNISNDDVLRLDNGDIVSGYFRDKPHLELAIAIGLGRRHWLSTLVHEFSHFEQWRDYDPTYIVRYNKTTPDTIIQKWLGGKDYNERTINKCIDLVKKCELNCERRAVKNIKKYNLPIDIKEYSKQASAYIHSYNYLKLTRRWNPPNELFPSEITAIIDEMPATLNGRYNKMSKRLLEIYDRELGYTDRYPLK